MNSSHRSIHATHASRELASRDGDGVHVLPLWHPQDNALTVSVEDARVGERFEIAVERTAPSMPSTTPSPMRHRESETRPDN